MGLDQAEALGSSDLNLEGGSEALITPARSRPTYQKTNAMANSCNCQLIEPKEVILGCEGDIKQ